VRAIVAQARPILIGQFAGMAFAVVDTVLSGHASSVDLATMGLGLSVYATVSGRSVTPPLLGEECMNARAALAASLGLALVVLVAAAHGEAAEIKVLSTVGMQPATPELFSQFEAATGHRVVVTYGLAAVLKTKLLEGAPADVLILTAPIIEDLAKQGKVGRRQQEGCRTVRRGHCGESGLGQARHQHV
jgi:hypothetical protein